MQEELAIELSLDQIDEILGPAPVPLQTSKYVRWYDTEMRCLSRRCGSSTYIKVQGVPYCMMHTIRKLTEILDGIQDQREIESSTT